MLDDEVAGQVLELFERGRGRLGIVNRGVHLGRSRWVVAIECDTAHRVEIGERVVTRRIVRAEKEPESRTGFRPRRASVRPRLIRPQL